jgi:hypothetical protein
LALGSEYATPPAAPLWLRSGVLGPTGEILTLADLPPSKPGRWVARRKAEVLAALMGGLLTVETICRKYDLSEEELLSWMRAYSRRGLGGLKARALRAVHVRVECS